jgi:hypothetical protein
MDMEVEDGADAGRLLAKLEESLHFALPDPEIAMLLHNGRAVPLAERMTIALNDGDTLWLMPSIYGG